MIPHPPPSTHVFLEISEFQNRSAEHLHNHYLSERDEKEPGVTLLTNVLCQSLWSVVLHNHRQDVKRSRRDWVGVWSLRLLEHKKLM